MNNLEKFKKDLVNNILDAFKEGNVNFNYNNDDYTEVVETYFSILNKVIGPRKRSVFISNELQDKMKNNDKINNNIEILKSKIENGKDINGCLSKTYLTKPIESDKLLDEWGVHHLHISSHDKNFFDLNRKMEPDLLMVTFTKEKAYFIDVTNHDKNDWFNINYIKIVKNNWPSELLFCLGKSDEQNLTSDEIKDLRKNKLNCGIVYCDGYAYRSIIGLGFNFCETSMKTFYSLIDFNKLIESIDFDYDHMEFKPYFLNFICSIFDINGMHYDIVLI